MFRAELQLCVLALAYRAGLLLCEGWSEFDVEGVGDQQIVELGVDIADQNNLSLREPFELLLFVAADLVIIAGFLTVHTINYQMYYTIQELRACTLN